MFLLKPALFIFVGMKGQCGKLPGLIPCMETSWPPVPMTGKLSSGRKKMGPGKRHTNTQGMIPQVWTFL